MNDTVDIPRGRRDLSMVVAGLVIANRIPATTLRPEWFCEPYNKAIEILQKRGACIEDVAKVVNPEYLNDAHEAVSHWNGISEEINWPSALATSYRNEEAGRKLKKVGKRLEENEPVDLLQLYGELGSMVSSESFGLTLANQIDYSNYHPFMKSGDPVQDKVLGGMPTDGPIIGYGLTGVGKSHWLASKIDYFLHEHKKKTAAIYTLEMSAEHYLYRETKMYPSLLDVMDRLHVSGSVRSIEELVAEITAKQVDIVGLDDIDNIVHSSDPSEYERVFRRIKEVCRFMKIPFYALGQPNRAAKIAIQNGERFLTPYDIAWSGASENSAALLVGIQKVNGLDMGDNPTFPTVDDWMYYEIYWKSRDGWPADYSTKGQQGPGAVVRLPSKQLWRGDVYGNRYQLWQPGHNSSSIGKKKSKKSRDED